MSVVAKVAFTDYRTSIHKSLDLIGAAAQLPQSGLIIIKPNLTNADKPPVTTNVKAAEAVCTYCTQHSKAEVAIGEGSGTGLTKDSFDNNGYTDLGAKYGMRLIDFNEEEAVRLHEAKAFHWKRLYLPKIAIDAFVISLPVLKDHSFTSSTIAMKNMFGLPPSRYYSGSWNKSKLHSPSTHESVVDVCLYKKPDLCVVDASLALFGMHLAGSPRILNVILASFDPVAVDTVGSELLGHDPNEIEYLRLAHGRIGDMKNIEILEG